MSQPLSQGMGRKVPIEKPPKRSYIMPNEVASNDARTERSIPMRDAVILLLFLTSLIAAPVGAGFAWGVGVGVFVLGVSALILAVLLGLD
ncbi:membrane protein [Gordonia phage Kabocha]|uniref:Membrane protein n=2 Tax=Chidieberevirus TaxID=3044687 RepID=A0A649VKI6_9CAUD|nr:membrane protein [Gordonia phage Chidiebere]YP_010675661.1 membrane protein [Gordonia phage ChisanaKitsune]AZS07873.1 membrane protein [Gordonia phage Gray]WAA19806.1 membrane protein [Gordonia phage Kabocha]WAA19996.1 membrane protein [Gordonia phage Hanem]WNM67038.1 membrane protein [Gordonia Phage Schomber]QGJ92910.1 membrane protein [Gordonia phage Chidiebere]